MGLLWKSTLFIISIGIAFSLNLLYSILRDDPVPLIRDEYWGPKSEANKKQDVSIHPFKIDISPSVIDDLKIKLKSESSSNRLAPPLENVGFQYGFNSKFVKVVSNYWMDKYNWTERQGYLNRYPHFKTNIGGLDIHFQHAKPKKLETNKFKKTVPILLLHGWPGTFVEFQKLIPLFLEPENSDINFEVVIPSLPGYGFSSPSSRSGMSTTQMANIFGRLMKRLGYEKYYLLGEDWGSVIVAEMSILYPERVKGTHAYCISFQPRDVLKLFMTYLYPSQFMNQRAFDRFYPLSKMISSSLKESGYLHIQATKPDTIGVALTHSPTGLMAYILEKFSTWTNSDFMDQEDGGLLHKFTMDELLDNVMIYWVTGSITSSTRLYSEFFNATGMGLLRVPVKVPMSCMMAPDEVIYYPEIALSSKYHDIRKYTQPDEGGHFTAYQVPHTVAKVALQFFNELEYPKSVSN